MAWIRFLTVSIAYSRSLNFCRATQDLALIVVLMLSAMMTAATRLMKRSRLPSLGNCHPLIRNRCPEVLHQVPPLVMVILLCIV